MAFSLKTKYFADFMFYKNIVGGTKVFLSLFLSLVVGLLDSIGLIMFMPLIEIVLSGGGTVVLVGTETNWLNNFFYSLFNFFGFDFNLFGIAIFLVGVYIIKGCFKLIERFYAFNLRLNFLLILRQKLVSGINELRYLEFLKFTAGRIHNTLNSEVGRVSASYRNYFLMIQNMIFLAVYLVVAIYSNWHFALMVGIGGYLTNNLFRLIYSRTKVQSKSVSNAANRYAGHLVELVSFFKYLKITNQSNMFSSKVYDSIIAIDQAERKMAWYESILTAFREPTVIFVLMGSLIIEIEVFGTSANSIVISLLFFYRSMNYVIVVQNYWNSYLNASGALQNVRSFMEGLNLGNETLILQGTNEIKFQDKIEFQDVSVSIAGSILINKVNLQLYKNKTTSIIGPSGSGKSTIINVLSGLIAGSETSKVLIDEKPITTHGLTSLRSRIGYVGQDPIVFDDTILNNIVCPWTNGEVNFEKFERICDLTLLSEFIGSLENRENTLLGNNGAQLSGGQRQRLNIARELYRDIDILILDEATAALDTETERLVQQNIDMLKGKYTLLTVAHRLSTIVNSDFIYILDNGKVGDSGSFEDLIKRNSGFKNLVQSQSLI